MKKRRAENKLKQNKEINLLQLLTRYQHLQHSMRTEATATLLHVVQIDNKLQQIWDFFLDWQQ